VNAFNYTSPRLSCDQRNKLNLKNIFKTTGSGSDNRNSLADEVEATTVEDSTAADPEKHEEEVEESTVGDPEEEEVTTTTRRPFRPKRPPPLHKRPTRRPWGKQCRRCKGRYRGERKKWDDGWRLKRFYGKKGKNKN
jgi:hypothetical protein